MNGRPKMPFFPLCDLHHSPMRRVLLEGSASVETQPSTSANAVIVIASSAMAAAIRILPPADLMLRACFFVSVPFAEERSTSLKWTTS